MLVGVPNSTVQLFCCIVTRPSTAQPKRRRPSRKAVRRRVFEAVRRTGKMAAVREILRKDLLDNDAEVRIRAGRGLVALRDPKAIPYLVSAAAMKACSCRRARRPRAHVAFVTQTAVLSRMSAEIA